jgi:hypothetical protein
MIPIRKPVMTTITTSRMAATITAAGTHLLELHHQPQGITACRRALSRSTAKLVLQQRQARSWI